MAVDLFAAGSAQTLVLLAARVGGLVMVAPVFSTKNVPVAVRACLIVLLTVLLQPVAFTQSTSVASITPETFVGDCVTGCPDGFAVRGLELCRTAGTRAEHHHPDESLADPVHGLQGDDHPRRGRHTVS